MYNNLPTSLHLFVLYVVVLGIYLCPVVGVPRIMPPQGRGESEGRGSRGNPLRDFMLKAPDEPRPQRPTEPRDTSPSHESPFHGWKPFPKVSKITLYFFFFYYFLLFLCFLLCPIFLQFGVKREDDPKEDRGKEKKRQNALHALTFEKLFPVIISL